MILFFNPREELILTSQIQTKNVNLNKVKYIHALYGTKLTLFEMPSYAKSN